MWRGVEKKMDSLEKIVNDLEGLQESLAALQVPQPSPSLSFSSQDLLHLIQDLDDLVDNTAPIEPIVTQVKEEPPVENVSPAISWRLQIAPQERQSIIASL